MRRVTRSACFSLTDALEDVGLGSHTTWGGQGESIGGCGGLARRYGAEVPVLAGLLRKRHFSEASCAADCLGKSG